VITSLTTDASLELIDDPMTDVVTINPNVLGGTPVFAGTRVPVESLFDYLKRGRTVDYFLEQFPSVRRQQVEQLLDEAQTRALSGPVPA
jgi:uncharacterized protein (DUF433 family)